MPKKIIEMLKIDGSNKLAPDVGTDATIFIPANANNPQRIRQIAQRHRDSFAKNFNKGWTHYRTAFIDHGGKVTYESHAIPF
jgi:hypothetical protein